MLDKAKEKEEAKTTLVEDLDEIELEDNDDFEQNFKHLEGEGGEPPKRRERVGTSDKKEGDDDYDEVNVDDEDDEEGKKGSNKPNITGRWSLELAPVATLSASTPHATWAHAATGQHAVGDFLERVYCVKRLDTQGCLLGLSLSGRGYALGRTDVSNSSLHALQVPQRPVASLKVMTRGICCTKVSAQLPKTTA